MNTGEMRQGSKIANELNVLFTQSSEIYYF